MSRCVAHSTYNRVRIVQLPLDIRRNPLPPEQPTCYVPSNPASARMRFGSGNEGRGRSMNRNGVAVKMKLVVLVLVTFISLLVAKDLTPTVEAQTSRI